MIRKVVKKGSLHDPAIQGADLNYWLARPPSERIEAVEILRRRQHGVTERLQRVARVVQQARR